MHNVLLFMYNVLLCWTKISMLVDKSFKLCLKALVVIPSQAERLTITSENLFKRVACHQKLRLAKITLTEWIKESSSTKKIVLSTSLKIFIDEQKCSFCSLASCVNIRVLLDFLIDNDILNHDQKRVLWLFQSLSTYKYEKYGVHTF